MVYLSLAAWLVLGLISFFVPAFSPRKGEKGEIIENPIARMGATILFAAVGGIVLYFFGYAFRYIGGFLAFPVLNAFGVNLF